MPKRKRGNPALWSVARVRDPRYVGLTVRITELRSGGVLFACFRKDGRQKMKSLKLRRRDLGSTAKAQREKARAIALDVIEALATTTDSDESAAETPEVLTLGRLVDLYQREGLHGVGLSYGKAQVTKLRKFVAFLGSDKPVVSLCKSDIQRYAAHRAKDDGVGLNTIRGDVTGLKIALNFAMDHKHPDGTPLLVANPLQRVRVPHEEPLRPWTTPERYAKLKAVADELPAAFGPILDLAWATGRRISAILGLRWRDISFEATRECPNGAVRWYAGATQDKKKKDTIVPMNPLAHEALVHWREQSPGIGAGWVFASPRDPSRALGQQVAAWWLRKAEELAQVVHLDRGGFHMMRRGWATQRKGLSVKDVAVAGGWQRTETLLTCYQCTDPATILAVVNNAAG